MAKIVELCGSPGVGKSSIFYEIEKLRGSKENNTWTTATNTNPEGDYSKRGLAKKIYSKIRQGKNKVGRPEKKENFYVFAKRIYREIKVGRQLIHKEAADRFIAQNPLYIDAIWKNIFHKQAQSSNGLDLRFEKAQWIYRIIKKIQIIKENNSEQYFIIDEGLINMIDRALYKSKSVTEENAEILELLEVIPLPDALVYIETGLDENVRRIICREDIRDMHLGMTEENLRNITQTTRERILNSIKYLENRGTPVLYLNSTISPKQNAIEIIRFSEKLDFMSKAVNSFSNVSPNPNSVQRKKTTSF